jgi:hypothetical protein
MERSRKKILLVSLLAAALSLSVALSAKAVRNYEPQAGENKTTFKWTPVRTEVSSEKSHLLLDLPDLAPDADWIVGVQPVENGEKESISVGLVSWEDSSRNPALAGKPFNFKVISQVTDYPADKIQVSGGRVSLTGLDHFNADSGSLMVYLKVSPGTKVVVRRGGREFVKDSADEGLIVHNGTPNRVPVKGIHSLVGRLVRSKVAPSAGRGR